MALREYLCNSCGHQFEEIVRSSSPEDYRYTACRCGANAEVLPPLIGGYQGNMGGGSTRPKNSSSMKRAKTFTGNKKETDK